ncbi:MAG: RAMP superfamily CRISPR-associated protein, partial [Candidatus Delongbacteria bacterium]|nr:RAMP superfamily CRISPR-associated protein [Candidatus Delongbacteria bacterium]
EYIDKDDLLSIRSLLRDEVLEEKLLYKSDITKDFDNKFNDKFESENNQLLVEEMYRNKSNGNPVLPGSSLKGAVRTAVISELSKSGSGFNDKRFFESEVLKYRDAKHDPFRAIRLTDCEITGNNHQIVGECFNYNYKAKDGQYFSNMQMILEQIQGIISDGDAKGICDLTIDEKLQNTQFQDNNHYMNNAVSMKISLKDIINSCNNFYKKHLFEEHGKHYKQSLFPELKKSSEKLLQLAEEMKDNECLIRAGRFSHVENVTVDKHREPRSTKGWGETRTISDKKYPMGWVKLVFDEI